MTYEKLINNIELLSAEKGVNKTTALVESGVGKNFIYNLNKGSAPSTGKIQQLAEYFGVSTDYLLGRTDITDGIKSNIAAVVDSSNIYNIPVFESVSAGFGAYASSDVLEYIPVIITNPADVEDTIAIKVKGDSMYPKIEDGDLVVVRRQTSVDKGDIAVVLLDGEEGLVKRVMYDNDWIELQSINPEYKTRRYEGADVLRLQVVGKVIQIIKTL